MFKYRGLIEPGSTRHALLPGSDDDVTGDVPRVYDEWTHKYDIRQYAPTVRGREIGYNPAADCEGAFMLFKNQIDNNCYAYACRIATNTYPQPGRASKGSVNILEKGNLTAENVQQNACKDGLVLLRTEMPDPRQQLGEGHLVALLFATPISEVVAHHKHHKHHKLSFGGDYHWVRCDDPSHYARWSQKDGSGQPAEYDFAGHPIQDPRSANWTATYSLGDHVQCKIIYVFESFMWVTRDVNII